MLLYDHCYFCVWQVFGEQWSFLGRAVVMKGWHMPILAQVLWPKTAKNYILFYSPCPHTHLTCNIVSMTSFSFSSLLFLRSGLPASALVLSTSSPGKSKWMVGLAFLVEILSKHMCITYIDILYISCLMCVCIYVCTFLNVLQKPRNPHAQRTHTQTQWFAPLHTQHACLGARLCCRSRESSSS